jgi:hypothetical protein
MGLNEMSVVLLRVADDSAAMQNSIKKPRDSIEFKNPGTLRLFANCSNAKMQQTIPTHFTTVNPATWASNSG